MCFRSVNMPKWEMKKQVAEVDDSQFSPKHFGSLRPKAFEEFYRCFEEWIHEGKVRRLGF